MRDSTLNEHLIFSSIVATRNNSAIARRFTPGLLGGPVMVNVLPDPYKNASGMCTKESFRSALAVCGPAHSLDMAVVNADASGV